MPDLPLVLTKFTIPSVNPLWVSRPRLMARLQDGHDRRLTLLSAAPGSGKTTALAQYCARRGDVAWLSIDSADVDLARFATYLVAAISRVDHAACPGARALLATPSDAEPEPLAAVLINDLASLRHRLTIVLDDYHLAESDAVRRLMGTLVERLPQQVRLIIASRADPALPLARLRAGGGLAEVRGDDLRFIGVETASFFRQSMRLNLGPEAVCRLEARAEGWAAGLQLAGLALADTASGCTIEAIDAIGGGHRYVFDFLAEEVFRRCPEATRAFLLDTCLLERLSASACDALTGGSTGQAALEELERANLFVVPLDTERHWYRYHQLFAEFLRGLLARERPASIPGLCRRAAEWHRTAGDTASAIHYWLLAGEYARAADLMQDEARILLARGEVTRVLGWVGTLPAAVLAARPQLGLANAWALLIARGPSAALTEQLDALAPGAEVMTIRAFAALVADEVTRAAKLANEALALVAPDDWHLRSLTTITLARAAWQVGDVGTAAEAFAAAAAYGQRSGRKNLATGALFNVGRLEVLRGKLHDAVRVFDEAFALAAANGGAHMPMTSVGHIWYAQVLLELDRLDEARHEADDGVACCRPAGNVESLVYALVTLARVVTAQRDLQQAAILVEQAAAEAGPTGNMILQTLVWAVRTHVGLARGDREMAARWVIEAPAPVEPNPRQIFEQVTYGRALLAAGRTDEAINHLSSLLSAADEAACPGWAGWARVPLILALLTRGDTGWARELARDALVAAEQEGSRRPLLDEGAALPRLQAVLPADLSARLRSLVPSLSAGEPSDRSTLSDRELEVLRLIADGLSNQEIAGRLVVTEGTAKWHIHNILSKLDAHSRTQAIARARELGLLGPEVLP